MKLSCKLRELRGERPLSEIERVSGINRGTLSAIERGVMLPLDRQLGPLERAYGVPPTKWYSEWGLLAIQEGGSA